MERFIFVVDTHYGFEKRGLKTAPLHDQRAINAMLAFAEDFKPHHVVLGGDILDCGAVSHHNAKRPRKIEGMRLQKDAELARANLIMPLERTLIRPHRGPNKKIWIPGNHEDWIEDLLDKEPGLEGLVDPISLLRLEDYTHTEYGKTASLSPHLNFCHGDTVKGGENVAKVAVQHYAANIRFGHYHTHQSFTMTSPIDAELPRNGTAVPCLCTKDPKYNEGKPNRWAQGFLFGYIHSNGNFNDYVSIIINGKCVANGKEFSGG